MSDLIEAIEKLLALLDADDNQHGGLLRTVTVRQASETRLALSRAKITQGEKE